MRASRTGECAGSAIRSRTKASQLRTARSDHVVDGRHVGRPRLSLLLEHAAAILRQPVITALAFAGLLDPAALDPAAILEAEQGRVEGRERELQPAAGSLLDQLADLVSVPRPRFNQRQHEHLRAAFLQFRAEHGGTLESTKYEVRSTKVEGEAADRIVSDTIYCDVNYGNLVDRGSGNFGGRGPKSEGTTSN